MKHLLPLPRLGLAASVLLLLAACSDSDNNNGGNTPPPSDAQFSTETLSWVFDLPSGSDSLCFDIDAGEETVCDDGVDWDLKVTSGGRTVNFWTNSGVSGEGDGGALGLFDWTELLGWINATTDPGSGQDVSGLYFADSASSVFSQSSWYAYNLLGTHQLHPNYRVYLVDGDPSDSATPQFALQVIGYYGGSSGTTSGYPRIRWIDRAEPETVNEQTIDASSHAAWVYVDLATGDILELDAEMAAESTAWHIAFMRNEIKLNGGSSGPGSTAGFLGKTPDGFYDEDGEPVTATFTSTTPEQTLAELTAADMAEPARPNAWVSDSTSSVLNPPYTGSYPQPLDYGWFTYTPTTHFLTANPENGALLRSGTGDSYARFRLTDITYANPAVATSQTTWTLEFNVQPAASE